MSEISFEQTRVVEGFDELEEDRLAYELDYRRRSNIFYEEFERFSHMQDRLMERINGLTVEDGRDEIYGVIVEILPFRHSTSET